MEQTPACFGSIIGLHPEYEERYVILHKHTFPGVLQRIRQSGLSDYTIFLLDGLLFSHIVYTGDDHSRDMNSIASDPLTQEWWKLTDPMQYPLNDHGSKEWWTPINLLMNRTRTRNESASPARHAYRIQFNSLHKASDVSRFMEVIHQEEVAHNFTARLFHHDLTLYLYLESMKGYAADPFITILERVFHGIHSIQPMREVFHTDSYSTPTEKPSAKVFVTGCFDLLHSGHIAFLQEAAGFGQVYTCIGSDHNIQQLKGRYPVNSQDERKYMLEALSCVHDCRINSGWGIIDFEKELSDISPDIFIVNEDGHTPVKQELCKKLGIEYKILKRIPYTGLPVRSTTSLRSTCNIPFRIDLAGGWLDQPFVSKHASGPVLTISIEPTLEFNDRSGMASSTRRKAIELWHSDIPQGNREKLARMLFSYENPPGTKEVAGSQDSLGIVLPGLNKLDYNGNYWPESITSEHDESILNWIEEHLYLVTLGPREMSYSVLDNTHINAENASELANAANDCWNAIIRKDLHAFGESFKRSFEAQVAMFPNMVDDSIFNTIDQFKDTTCGWKLSGAGGGGYLILVSEKPIPNTIQVKIRRNHLF